MKTSGGIGFALAAGLLLAGWVGAQVRAVSTETALNTRSLSAVVAAEAPLDARSYTEEWSTARKLNTKKIIGTTIMIR